MDSYVVSQIRALASSPSILGLLLGAIVLVVVRQYSSSPKNHSLEVRGDWKKDDLRTIIRNEYLTNPDRAYAIELPGRQTIVMPFSLKNEYGWLSDSHASASEDLYDRSMGWYTGFGSYTPDKPGDPIMVDISYAKGPLTKTQSTTLTHLYEELDYALMKEVGDCSDAKEFGVHSLSSQICARVLQRIYVGPELARNERWLKACSTIGMTIGMTAGALATYSSLLRPFAYYFTKVARNFHQSQSEIQSFLKPLLQRCIENNGADSEIEPSNFVQYYVNLPGNKRKNDTLNLSTGLVGLNFAGITSIGFVIHELLLDLAAYPELAKEIREEVLTVKKNTGSEKLLQDGLNKLYKMDSWIKESLRYNTASVFSMTRKNKKDLKLSNGQTIPAGAYLVVPGSLNDKITLVKDTDPGFDAMRWYRMRQEQVDKDTNPYAWVTAGNDTMGFGYGVHACPGRFFATNAVKAMISEIVLRYDFSMPAGQVRKDPVVSKLVAREFDYVSKVLLKAR